MAERSSEDLETAAARLDIRPGTKILVVGQNGSGKSSVINEMLAQPGLAKVGRPEDETKHKPIEECKTRIANNIDVSVFDTRGFCDPSVEDKETMKARSIAKTTTFDLVLICHKLYGRVDAATINELKVLVDHMGKNDSQLFNIAIFVFTFGDEYLIRCEPEFTNDGKLTEKSKEEVKSEMELQKKTLEKKLKDALIQNGVRQEMIDRIPSCISCGKRQKNGSAKELPTCTGEYWVNDLWRLCVDRCRPEAKKVVVSLKGEILETMLSSGIWFGMGGAVIASSQAVGAVTNSVTTFPGVGTVLGAAVGGAVVGGFVYGTIGATMSGVLAAASVGISIMVRNIRTRNSTSEN